MAQGGGHQEKEDVNMEVFAHGDYMILDGTKEELEQIVSLVGNADQRNGDLKEGVGKIRRGLNRGATKIAVTVPQATELHNFLEKSQKEGTNVFANEIKKGLKEGSADSGIN